MRSLIFASMMFSVACGGQISGADGGSNTDASTTSDAGVDACVDIVVSAFDTSCQSDPDCISIASGSICSGYTCLCPNATISASAEAQYEAEISKVTPGSLQCECPLFGSPHCISSQCVFCPNPAINNVTLPPGCPDGGS